MSHEHDWCECGNCLHLECRNELHEARLAEEKELATLRAERDVARAVVRETAEDRAAIVAYQNFLWRRGFDRDDVKELEQQHARAIARAALTWPQDPPA